MPKLKTTAQFIQDARQVHGNKYDYSESVYLGACKKLTIRCKKHGVFLQTPHSHCCGKGCPGCGIESTKTFLTATTEEFIQKANRKHRNKYTYPLCEYKDQSTAVLIRCEKHGDFSQPPKSHLRGNGCPHCSGRAKFDNKTFIEKVRIVHGDTYGYDYVQYDGSNTRLKIECKKHGIFLQAARSHLNGMGCAQCAHEKCSREYTLTTDEFIAKSHSVHGDEYDYALVSYTNSKTKVSIKCKSHGLFQQSPSSHLSGAGCPKCAKSGFNPLLPTEIYFLKFEKPFASFWKVGITNRTARERFAGDFVFVTSQYLWQLENGSDAYEIEQSVLREFKQYRFDNSFLFSLLQLGGDTECFTPALPYQKVIDFIEARVSSVQSPIAN